MADKAVQAVAEKLKNATTAAIFCHVRPDGDALGSGMALCLAMRAAGKKAYFVCEEKVPEKFLFLPALKKVCTGMPDADFDILISVDCAEESRMGAFAQEYARFKGVTVNIDHHISNTNYGMYNCVKERTATCEILPEILKEAGFEINKEIADLLMLGLVTDSGCFAHKDVTENTFLVAAELAKAGADVSIVNYNMYARQKKSRALLYARAMNSLRFALSDAFALVCVTAEDLSQTGADQSMTEGFADFPLSIDGVEVAAALMEVKHGQFKISLRSKGTVNVNKVASVFGGGGHILASGCMIFGEYEEVVERLTYAVYQYLT
ncbi:MAG: bifunctional oligoribonuclease/PAP phosphatase NrnA [Clostridia bacterium]|nr:bifunctional oligoribonuclease/PAP phosphatase NrnA [Clostridia bacterium]